MAVSKPLLTEFGILHHRLDSCAWFHNSFPCCLTGFHLHRHHTVRVLPWHGVECFHDGGLNLAMGWGPQRDLGSIGWDAGGLRLPCIPGSTPCLILRESRFVIQLITIDCRNKHILRVLCRNFSRISSDSVPNYCNHCRLQRPHYFVIFLFVYFLLSYLIVKKISLDYCIGRFFGDCFLQIASFLGHFCHEVPKIDYLYPKLSLE